MLLEKCLNVFDCDPIQTYMCIHTCTYPHTHGHKNQKSITLSFIYYDILLFNLI